MTGLPATAEVVIVGAGIMGCSIAHALAERGLRDVVVLERDAIGRGATADAAGGIRLQFSTETNIRLGRYSLGVWETFPSASASTSTCGSRAIFSPRPTQTRSRSSGAIRLAQSARRAVALGDAGRDRRN